jgi:uncharacterized protein
MSKFNEFIRRWRLLLLLLLPVLAVLAAQGASRLGFSSDYRVFFSESNPQLTAFERMQKTYAKSDNLLIVLAPKDGKVFSPQTLEAVEWITSAAWKTPYSVRVDSLSNFQRTTAEGDTINVSDLVKNATAFNQAKLDDVERFALSEPQLLRRLIAPDGAVTAINVTYRLPEKSPFETFEIVTFGRDLQQQIEKRYPGMTVHLTGMAMYNNAFFEAAMADEGKLKPILYVVIILAGLIMLRSIMATACAVLVVYLGVGAATGIAGWLGMSLTSLSASAPLVILTICVADSVHILAGVLRHLRQGTAKDVAIKETMRESVRPVVLTSLMNATGFLTLNFSEVPPFRDLGNIVAIGIGCAMVLSLTLLPALLWVLPFKPKQTSSGDFLARGTRRLGSWVVDRTGLVLGLSVPAALVIVACLFMNQFNDQYVRWFSPQTQFRQANDFTMSRLTGLYSIEYSLAARQAPGIAQPEFLTQVDAYAQWLRKQPEVVHVAALTDIFKRINQSMNGDEPAAYALPESGPVAAQSLLLYEMSLPYGLDLNNQINVDKTATRLTATLTDLTTSEMLAFESRSLEWLRANAPLIEPSAASTTLMFAHIGERNIHGILSGMLITAAVISLFLIVALRSWKLGLMSLIPNVLPVAMAFGVWGIFVGQLGFSVAIVATITLGIVVDDTVHFISAVQHALEDGRRSVREAVLHAFESTGSALVTTTVMLVAGFLVLGASSFALNQQMGIMTALTLALGLLIDFLLLPALIITFMEKKYATNQASMAPGLVPGR